MKKLSKKEVESYLEEQFSKKSLSREEIKKLKRLAMSKRVRLGTIRAYFCKKCFTDLRNVSPKISKEQLTKTCPYCKQINRVKIS